MKRDPLRLALTIFAVLISFNYLFAEVLPAPAAGDSDQQINDFSLAGYGDRGKKTWDIAGKTADIFADKIKLKKITGNMYGDENIKLTADRGDFNKAEGKIHLEQDVVITTDSGAKLTTNSLDWDRKNDTVATLDKVNIVRDNMVAEAMGATGKPALSKVSLEKEVKVQLLPAKEKDKDKESATGADKVVITCDGPLSIDYEKNFATFNNNVKVDRQDSQIYSDRMDIYFNRNSENKNSGNEENKPGMMNSKIEKIFAHGNVKIIRGPNVSYSDEAIYSALDNKITLLGRPKLILYSTEKTDVPSGN
jgi:LPS export ABC transporter protein LptC